MQFALLLKLHHCSIIRPTECVVTANDETILLCLACPLESCITISYYKQKVAAVDWQPEATSLLPLRVS